MGNRKNKSRSQKRKFIDNRFTERTKPLDVPTVASVASKYAMTEAAEEVRKLKNTSDVAECGVSVDGTWQRRGHSLLNGCVSVLSIDTGKVLDLEVMSKWGAETVTHQRVQEKVNM
ncbi:uncharacterized protein TNCV_3257271 [Trichonephila clavipes]|nr:uncharacterized protein TNCV_3257271 [Trichonephila clavipes]